VIISWKLQVTVKLLQVIISTATRIARRWCRERLDSSAPYWQKRELSVTI